MKSKLAKALRWCVERAPEACLTAFALAVLPLAFLLARGAVGELAKLLSAPVDYLRSRGAAPWTLAGALTCAAGTGVLAYVLWRNWTTVWAVARKMILEALHRRVVLVLLVFFGVLMPILPFVLKAAGSLKSQVQLVLLYSLVLALVLLSLLAIFVTTASVCSEVETKQVHITDTKPMRRWQFLLGKWFGVVVMCAGVLWVMALGTYVLVGYVARPPDYDQMTEQQAAKAMQERRELYEQVFAARTSVVTPLPDFSEEARKQALEALKKKDMAWAVHSYQQRIEKEMLYRSQAVRGGGFIRWKFTGLQPKEDGTLFVRFKPHASSGRQVVGRWFVYRPPSGDGSQESGRAAPRIVWSQRGTWSENDFHTISLSAKYVEQEGTLRLAFRNVDPERYVIFDVNDPVEVLQGTEGFFFNYYRSLAIIMVHVGLLAALGLMAGSLFSFPVASLLVICFFIGGLIGPWFTQEFVQPDVYARLTSVTVYLDRAWRTFAGAVMAVMPNFGSFSPLGDLVNGRMVPMRQVLGAGAVLLYLKGGAAMLVGMYFYARRELAKTIV
ncbi:MAG: ABC transporter permease [Planctomycetota bacterium]